MKSYAFKSFLAAMLLTYAACSGGSGIDPLNPDFNVDGSLELATQLQGVWTQESTVTETNCSELEIEVDDALDLFSFNITADVTECSISDTNADDSSCMSGGNQIEFTVTGNNTSINENCSAPTSMTTQITYDEETDTITAVSKTIIEAGENCLDSNQDSLDGYTCEYATSAVLIFRSPIIIDPFECEGPVTEEICDGIDNDCDGEIDEDVKITFYQDQDGDGFGDPLSATAACTSPAADFFSGIEATDCDDSNDSIFPGATEDTENGIDDNCNGYADEGTGPATSIHDTTPPLGEPGVDFKSPRESVPATVSPF